MATLSQKLRKQSGPQALKMGENPDKVGMGSRFWVHLNHLPECKKFPDKNYCRQPELKSIIPLEYFTTTGDVETKLTQLIADAYALAGAATTLKNLAKKSRFKDKYLETTLEGPDRIVEGEAGKGTLKIWAARKSPRKDTQTDAISSHRLRNQE